MDNFQLYNRRMEKCIEENPHMYVGYLTAGYPDRETFFQLVSECCKRGMPALEVGFPSGNPYEDGEVIRQAHSQVGTELGHDMEFWRRLRRETNMPIWLMGYREDLVDTKVCYELAEEGLFDVLVIPNMEIDGRLKLKEEMREFHIDMMGFVSTEDSFLVISKNFQEFPLIYQRLYCGPTGVKTNNKDYEELLDYSKMLHRNTIFAGFGISSGERVRELIDKGFYGAVIGTEIMRKLNQSPQELYRFVEELTRVTKGAAGV